MNAHLSKLVRASCIVAAGIVICATGIHIGDTGDAPGVSLLGILFLIGAIYLAIRTARRKT